MEEVGGAVLSDTLGFASGCWRWWCSLDTIGEVDVCGAVLETDTIK